MKSANQPKPMAPPPVPIQAKAVVAPKTPAAPVAPTAVQTPTPSLKLKIGGNFTPRATPPAPSNGSAAPKPVITVKPKAKKPKPVDPTPASVVDDGSFDLLEEVIAIEKEKEKLVAKKQRPFTTSPEAPAPVKRKKDLLDELEDDDEILALASPSKKPSKSPQPSTIEKEWRAISPAKFPGSIKLKKPPIPVPEHAPSPEVKPPPEVRQQPTKGKEKEKEVVPQAPSRASVSSEAPLNKARAREVLKTLLKLPEAAIFSRPVDPIQDGCPTYTFYPPIYSTRANAVLPTHRYFDEIKHPMDFGTMMQNLNSGKYSTREEFSGDVGLVFSNCRLFNPPTTYPVQCAEVLERAFKKEWARAAEKKMAWTEKRSLQSLMTTLVKEPLYVLTQ
jgi:transcription initiation factor TFIID subunit 2